MQRKVLISAPYMLPVLERFAPVFRSHDIEVVAPPVRERLSEDELLRWVGDVEGIICGDDRITARVLDAAPRLKVIAKWGTGIDSIDRAAAERRGIRVSNTPDAFTQCVADTVLGYILCFARQLPWADRDMRAGEWSKRVCVTLAESTIGVIGVGHAGRAVVERAHAFGSRLLGNDVVSINSDFLERTGLEMVEKETLLREADFITLNCDLNPTSYHLIGRAELRLVKPEAVIINTARGPVIDERELIEALAEGRIGGAALDVFEEEPLPLDCPLRQFPNVMLAPHNANSGRRAWEAVHQRTIRNLLTGLGITSS